MTQPASMPPSVRSVCWLPCMNQLRFESMYMLQPLSSLPGDRQKIMLYKVAHLYCTLSSLLGNTRGRPHKVEPANDLGWKCKFEKMS